MGLTGFGFGEVLIIAMLVLIVFGPKRLPEITRTIGKGIREFKKGMNEIQRELESAGREETWSAPPKAPTVTAAAGTATIAGPATATESAGDDVSEDAEDSDTVTSEDTSPDEATAATDGDVAPDDGPDGATEPTNDADLADSQTPPVSRDHVDPAEEFIDPWSTDSSRPTFDRTPASAEPVIAAEEPVIAAEEPDIAAEEPDIAAEEPVIAAEEPVIAPPAPPSVPESANGSEATDESTAE